MVCDIDEYLSVALDEKRGNHVISLRGLSKRYGDRLAVDDLSLDLRPGTVTGFLGPNGRANQPRCG